MANPISETESALTLVVVAVLCVLLFYLFGGIDFLKGLAKGGADAAGAMQSVKNAADGFPSGADPGTIPFFQIFQGIMESLRNLTDLHIGPQPADPGSATAEEQALALATYTPPTQDQVQTVYTAAPVAVGNFFNTAQSNPGALPFF